MPTMDVEHCVIAIPIEVAKFKTAADKRRYNVFLICLVVSSETTVQKYELFPIWQNKKCLRKKTCGGEWFYR